ncbi:MAG: hypothetical protein HQK49_22470 [Oligoflexia bacterium]|nr:hypothetical protein [Oligoflexia bacterium]
MNRRKFLKIILFSIVAFVASFNWPLKTIGQLSKLNSKLKSNFKPNSNQFKFNQFKFKKILPLDWTKIKEHGLWSG